MPKVSFQVEGKSFWPHKPHSHAGIFSISRGRLRESWGQTGKEHGHISFITTKPYWCSGDMHLLKGTNYLIARPGFKRGTCNIPKFLVRLNYKLLWANEQKKQEEKPSSKFTAWFQLQPTASQGVNINTWKLCKTVQTIGLNSSPKSQQ